MAEYKRFTIKRIVDVVILVVGIESDVIYNVSRNPLFDMIPIV